MALMANKKYGWIGSRKVVIKQSGRSWDDPGDIEYDRLVIMKYDRKWCIVGKGLFHSGFETKKEAVLRAKKYDATR